MIYAVSRLQNAINDLHMKKIANTQAYELSIELDLPFDDSNYRQTDRKFWESKVKKLQRDKIIRDGNRQRLLAVSAELNEPLFISPDTRSNKAIYREIRRIRMRKRRADVKTTIELNIKRQKAIKKLIDIRRRRANIKKIEKYLADTYSKRNDKLIQDKKFQRILDNITEQKEGSLLSSSQADRFYDSMRGQARYTLTIEHEEKKSDKIITLNHTNKKALKNLLSKGPVIDASNDYLGGSDPRFDANFEDAGVFSKLTLTERQAPARVIPNRDGKFFAYINTTDINLLEYQIFNQNNAYNAKLINNREHCILHSLKECGVNDAKLNNVKMAFKTGCNIRKNDLVKIAKIIERDITLHEIRSDGKINNTTFECDQKLSIEDTPAEIAIYENHYFVYKNTEYSKYFITHYAELRDVPNAQNIIREDSSTKSGYRYSNGAKINSLRMIDKLFKDHYFQKLDLSLFEESGKHAKLKDLVFLDNIEQEQEPMENNEENANDDDAVKASKKIKRDKKAKKIKRDESFKIYYGDCETYVHEINHQLQLLGVVSDDDDSADLLDVSNAVYQNKQNSPAQLVVWEFLKIVTNDGKNNAKIYFHNVKYDGTIFEPYLNITDKCAKDNQIYSITTLYKGKTVELRDSYKIIPFALSKFQEEFKLPKEFAKKEAIAYTYFTPENAGKLVSVDEYKTFLSIDQQKIFDINILDEPTYDPKTKLFDPKSDYKNYLRLDCLCLKKGLQKMNSLIREITGGKMSIYDCLTISSLTDKYMIKEGAYDDVYQMKGNLRAYVAKAIYGGRVQANQKYVKKTLEGKFADYDGVSLYPSAINRLCRESGLPTGPAKRFKREELSSWESKIYSILTIKITKVNKSQQMPFIAHKTKNAINYINEAPPDEIVIDSITARDYINFHHIEFDIIDGVYWDKGVNNKMGAVIQRLFQERLKHKETNEALANTIKLMLNSAYGKTIMKKTMVKNRYFKASSKKLDTTTGVWTVAKRSPFDEHVYNNFNTIKSFRKINDNTYEVESICCDDSYNRGHIGCMVLSMSKRIMNEVFDVANDNNIPIFYQDTDSQHMNWDDVSMLEEKFYERYGKILTGKNLEQFHGDFKLKKAAKGADIYATKSIFLGKKSYMDLLESKNDDGEIITGYHLRMKGITEDGLKHASKDYKNSYLGLYQDLANGTIKKMILNPFDIENNKSKVLFEFKAGRVSTRKEFTREVSF